MKKYEYDITIIVPVYNNKKYIDACVKSILKQKFNLNRIQVFLINDGSNDGSLEKIKKYESDNIFVIDKVNTGVSDTRNVGIKKALGKYIMFLDSDDYISKDTCKILFNFFEKHYDEIDLITYPIINDRNGKHTMHGRYKKLYTKGTGIYDLNENYHLIQTTINIFIKNKFKDNIMFDVNQKFSEDEHFATEVLMKKKKLGFCENAKYYYRHHDGTATNNKANAYYCFEPVTLYYENLFKKYSIKDKVPKYIQMLYLNNLRWRISKDLLYPYHYDEENYKKAIERITNLLAKIDIDVITNLDTTKFHKFYLLNLKNKKSIIKVGKDGCYKILCDDTIIDEENNITSLLNRFKIDDNKIILNGDLITLAFEIVKPEIYIAIKDINNKTITKTIDTKITNMSYYKSNIKTNTIYGYKLELDMDTTKSFKLYAKINDIKIPIVFKFNRFTSRKVRKGKIRVAYSNQMFVVTKNNLYFKIKDWLKGILVYIKRNPKILINRLLSNTNFSNKKVWLYNDNGKTFDNGYIQFKHDILKDDGIKRYYVYDTSFDNIKNNFSTSEYKYLVKKGTIKHKRLFFRAEKILSSFSDLQVYCPFGNKINLYKDLIKYDFIYLQHGILHANLISMYSKGNTQIDKFVISTSFEEKNLIENYDYEKKDLIECGMPRIGINDKISKEKNVILFAPSWRKYLIGDLKNNKRALLKDEFLKSKYFSKIYDFLHSKELEEYLVKNKLKLDFRLHPIFTEYKDLFDLKDNKNISINFGDINIGDYKIFITDFSSFQFDFVKLKKPIIYFVPDMTEFKAGLHSYRELDLKYEDAFGKLCLTSEELIKEVINITKNKYKVEKKYLDRMDKFFLDIKNPCEDIYNTIKK